MEAFVIVPCRVQLEALTNEDVVRFKRELKMRSRSRTKRPIAIRKVPVAIKEIEVTTTNCEYNCFVCYFYKIAFINHVTLLFSSDGLHVERIVEEHSYSRPLN